MRLSQEYTIWNAVTPVVVTSSTDATPIVVSATAHGFMTGDLVMINGHTTNLNANGIFKITRIDANSFSLQNYDTGANIIGSGGGAGAGGVAVIAPKVLLVSPYVNVILSLFTSGSLNATIKIAGSLGKLEADSSVNNTPNFGATISKSNPYAFTQIINLADAVTVNGGTGITSAGTDIQAQYEVNINAMKYICPILTAWVAGVITLKAQVTDNR